MEGTQLHGTHVRGHKRSTQLHNWCRVLNEIAAANFEAQSRFRFGCVVTGRGRKKFIFKYLISKICRFHLRIIGYVEGITIRTLGWRRWRILGQYIDDTRLA